MIAIVFNVMFVMTHIMDGMKQKGMLLGLVVKNLYMLNAQVFFVLALVQFHHTL